MKATVHILLLGERKEKTGRACVLLSRCRDLLPSRHGRPARHRASGFTASELPPNIPSGGTSARALARCRAILGCLGGAQELYDSAGPAEPGVWCDLAPSFSRSSRPLRAAQPLPSAQSPSLGGVSGGGRQAF